MAIIDISFKGEKTLPVDDNDCNSEMECSHCIYNEQSCWRILMPHDNPFDFDGDCYSPEDQLDDSNSHN